MQRIDFDTIDSTNTYLKNNYEKLENMTFVGALLQTEGRGRNNRRWLSNRGDSLMFSLLIKDPVLLENYRSLSVLAAYCVVRVLERQGIRELSIKWPNDVYAGDEKICGILLEGVSREKLECLIIGSGLNVNQKAFEGEYLRQPTSVYLQTGRLTDLETLKTESYEEFEKNLERLENGHDFHSEIVRFDYLKGRTVMAEIRGSRQEVTIIGINDDYSLRVSHNGDELNIDSGEITFHL